MNLYIATLHKQGIREKGVDFLWLRQWVWARHKYLHLLLERAITLLHRVTLLIHVSKIHHFFLLIKVKCVLLVNLGDSIAY